MRMFRFSSWISESRGGDEVADGIDPRAMADDAGKPQEVVTVHPSKRKREDDWVPPMFTPDLPPVAKRWKADPMDSGIAMDVQVDEPEIVQPEAAKMDDSRLSQARLRETIESQLSLEILLKHDELRLINQELAKSQAALEQLRRCHLIPYPISQGISQDISNGTGSAIIPGQGGVRPQWAAPFGVTDGPYTRHYAKWLIPDPSFDGIQPEWDRSFERGRSGKTISEGRTTRNSFTDASTPVGKARTQRGSAGQKLHALPSGYTQSKENAGPSVLKRPDGQYVKLVCIDCRRENFGSTQGFINHCRIAHRREFKSHEEAAVQSGVPIELDEIGGIVGEEKHAPVATGLVHPLILTAPTDKNAYAALLSRISASLNMYHDGKLPGVTSIPGSPNATPQTARSLAQTTPKPNLSFIPSTATPHLSELMRARGFDGNLGEMVVEAKTVEDLDILDSEDSDSEKPPSPVSRIDSIGAPADVSNPPMRIPARAGLSSAPFGRPGSSKGPESNQTSRKPGISPLLPFATPIDTSTIHQIRPSVFIGTHHGTDEDIDHDISMMDAPLADLSPNTSASNNAPSLVSDDGEYDEGDDDADSSLGGSVGEEEDSDVAEIELEDDEKVVPRTAPRHRSGSSGEGAGRVRLKKEDKHVTFVSPVKDARKERHSKK